MRHKVCWKSNSKNKVTGKAQGSGLEIYNTKAGAEKRAAELMAAMSYITCRVESVGGRR